MLCELCSTDEAIERHHVLPKSKGGRNGTTIRCCRDCGGQIHMLFTNQELALMTLEDLLGQEKMIKYIGWKRKHPGEHRHRMSRNVKEWRKGHRC